MSKINNILLVARHPVGGIKTYFRYVYEDETLYDYNFAVACSGTDKEEFSTTFGERLKYFLSSQSNLQLLKNVFKSLFTFKPDIIHSHGLTSAMLVAPIAFLFRVKHVVTLHDVFLPSHFSGTKGKLKWHVLNLMLKLPTVINPCGYDTEKNLKQYFPNLNPKKIETIQNGIATELFAVESRRDLKQELALSEETILLGFLGRFMKQKGFDLLIDAIAQLDNPNIKVACFGWGGFIREEQQKIERMGLAEQFHFLPHTNQVAHALRGLDLLIIPSRWEACPLLPMEAMVAGVPFIGSDCIGLHEVMQESPGVQFTSENVDSLIEKISQSLPHIPELKAQATSYQLEAKRRFSCDNLKQKLHQLYTK